jgi:hypothetical protein
MQDSRRREELVGQFDRVAVWLSSRVETAVALLAWSRNGYVCCPSLHRDGRGPDAARGGSIRPVLFRPRRSALVAAELAALATAEPGEARGGAQLP